MQDENCQTGSDPRSVFLRILPSSRGWCRTPTLAQSGLLTPLSLTHNRGWPKSWSTVWIPSHWGCWGGFLMAFNANLRVFACDLISHGAPRGWVTSAPVAEWFFFPLEAPACGIMWFCKIFSFIFEARFPPRLLQRSHSYRLGNQQMRAKNAFCLKMPWF